MINVLIDIAFLKYIGHVLIHSVRTTNVYFAQLLGQTFLYLIVKSLVLVFEQLEYLFYAICILFYFQCHLEIYQFGST